MAASVPPAVLAGLAVGCSAPVRDYEPFTAPAAELYAKTTIVMTPVRPPEGLELPESSLVVFDSLIAWNMTRAGFNVVPAARYTVVWSAVLENTSLTRDSAFDEDGEAQIEAARTQLMRRLAEEDGADAILYAEIWYVEADFADGTARWDGVSESMIGFGTRFAEAVATAFDPDREGLPSGTVPALSLMVFVEDAAGRELYANAGGIQLLEKIGRSAADHVEVPPEQVLRDRGGAVRAVKLAMGPLLDRRP